MPVDPKLLANYERDWNEALEQYDASLRAARMANVNYDPASRIFEASQPPGSGERLQREIFGPLQMKYGALTGSRAAATAPTRPVTFNTPVGIFERDRFSGEYKKMVDVPQRTGVAALTPEQKAAAAAGKTKLASDLRNADAELRELRALLNKEDDADKQNIILGRMAKASRKRNELFAAQAPAPAPALAAPAWQVNPMDIPYGAPKNPQGFIGQPGYENVFEPKPSVWDSGIDRFSDRRIYDEPPARLPDQVFEGQPAAQVGPSVQRGIRVLSIRKIGQ